MTGDDHAPAPAGDTTSAVAARIDRLVLEIGRTEPVARAIAAFLGRLDDMLLRSTENDDGTERHRAAHTLAGSAETLGAIALGTAARAIMVESVVGSSSALSQEQRERLLAEADTARQVLHAEMERRGWTLADRAPT